MGILNFKNNNTKKITSKDFEVIKGYFTQIDEINHQKNEINELAKLLSNEDVTIAVDFTIDRPELYNTNQKSEPIQTQFGVVHFMEVFSRSNNIDNNRKSFVFSESEILKILPSLLNVLMLKEQNIKSNLKSLGIEIE